MDTSAWKHVPQSLTLLRRTPTLFHLPPLVVENVLQTHPDPSEPTSSLSPSYPAVSKVHVGGREPRQIQIESRILHARPTILHGSKERARAHRAAYRRGRGMAVTVSARARPAADRGRVG